MVEAEGPEKDSWHLRLEIGDADIGNTIDTVQKDYLLMEINLTKKDMRKIYRIRKLTPKECLRLMAVSDADIDKIQHYPYVQSENGEWVLPDGMDEKDAKKLSISESQQYKMAGNSIVVQVLEGIFTQLFRTDTDSLF